MGFPSVPAHLFFSIHPITMCAANKLYGGGGGGFYHPLGGHTVCVPGSIRDTSLPFQPWSIGNDRWITRRNSNLRHRNDDGRSRVPLRGVYYARLLTSLRFMVLRGWIYRGLMDFFFFFFFLFRFEWDSDKLWWPWSKIMWFILGCCCLSCYF